LHEIFVVGGNGLLSVISWWYGVFLVTGHAITSLAVGAIIGLNVIRIVLYEGRAIAGSTLEDPCRTRLDDSLVLDVGHLCFVVLEGFESVGFNKVQILYFFNVCYL
jgi:hypothetical protein